MSARFSTIMTVSLRTVAVAALCARSFSPLRAQAHLTEAPPPDIERELREFHVDEGLEVNLFAADPLIFKPIQMHFDARGRLWVASSGLYPHLEPGDLPRDKVFVLTDEDGDGRADRSVVFAEGLVMPTGILPDDEGGAWVANSTELLYLKDHDGDDRADESRIVLSGFGVEDTHHILHTFRYGPGGNIYFNQSIYIHSHIETPYGVRRLGGGGIWQFRPETRRLDVYVYGMCNGWGHHFDRWGQSFGADGAYFEGVLYLMPGARYAGTPSSKRLMHGLNPGSPKYCSCEILSGRHLPEGFAGTFVTNDFRAHRVCRYELTESGSGYVAREVSEPLVSTGIVFRPVDVKMGPDGAIYIADWYNPIIQHGEVDFRSPMRNHRNGRIWRLSAKGRPPLVRPDLVGATTPELLDFLKAPEDWTRHHARRVLAHRDRAIVASALAEWAARLDPGDPDFEHHRLEALWTYQTIDVPAPGLLERVLRSPDHRVRAAATRIVGAWFDRLEDPLELLAPQVVDEHPRVRLEAVQALRKAQTPRAVELALTVLDRPMDQFLDYGLHTTANVLEPYWLPQVEAGELRFEGRPRHLEFALAALGSGRVVAQLVRLIDEGLSPERAVPLLGIVASQGDARALDFVAQHLPDVPLDAQPRLLAALVQSARDRGIAPERRKGVATSLLSSASAAVRAEAAVLAGVWKVEKARGPLEQLALEAPDERVRRAALDGIAALGGEASARFLDEQASRATSLQFRFDSVSSLASLDVQAAASRAVLVLAESGEGADAATVYRAFLRRRGGPEALAAALEGRTLPADVAKIGLRIATSNRETAGPLPEALAEAAGLTGEARPLSPAERRALEDSIVRDGDPARGEAIFRREDLACLGCHAIGGAGGLVGPDLQSIGATAQLDYLIDSVLDPSKAVKENYHAEVVATKDGRVLSGVPVRRSEDELVLRTADDEELVLRTDAILTSSTAGSLMPSGVADTLTTGELRDLLRFLSELGKVGPYAVGKAPTARRWRVRPAYTNDGFWRPAYATVAGELPLQELPRNRDHSEARCELDVTRPGRIVLELEEPRGLKLQVDGQTVELHRRTTIELGAGRHTLLFAIDFRQRKTSLSCRLGEAGGEAAHAQFVGGK